MSRSWPSWWRPSNRSRPTERTVSRTRSATASEGTSSSAASSVVRACATCPAAAWAAASCTIHSRRRSRRHQLDRLRDPARRGGRRGDVHRAGRVEQHADRVLVAGARRHRHVVRQGLRRLAARAQARRRALVREQPPAGAGRVVDRPAHERVADREPARMDRRAHEVGGDELVERVDRRPPVPPRPRRRRSRDRSRRRSPRRRRARSASSPATRRSSSASAADTARGTPGRVGSPVRGRRVGRARAAGQVLEVERVPAALQEQQLARGRRQIGVRAARRPCRRRAERAAR